MTNLKCTVERAVDDAKESCMMSQESYLVIPGGFQSATDTTRVSDDLFCLLETDLALLTTLSSLLCLGPCYI